MGKRKSKREAVRTITGGKPHHEDRTFDPYPIRCEVEPCQTASVGTTAEPTNTTGGEPSAVIASAPNSDPGDSDESEWDPDGYGNPF